MFANVMFYILFYFQGPKKSGFTFLRGRKHQELYMYRGGGGVETRNPVKLYKGHL